MTEANAASREARGIIQKLANADIDVSGTAAIGLTGADIIAARDWIALADEAASQPRISDYEQGFRDGLAMAASQPREGVEREAIIHAIMQAHDRCGLVDPQWVDAGKNAAIVADAAIAALHDTAPTDQAQGGEVERMHSLAKANNDLARLNGEHRDEWRAKAVRYAEALDSLVDALDHGIMQEPENYVAALATARAALAQSGDPS